MHIKKIIIDNIEYLPHIADTPLMDKWEYGTTTDKQKAVLYNAVVDRENYYQDHSVTAFGNTEYARYEGIVLGICQVLELDESATENTIVFRKNGRLFLEVDKIQRPQKYYNDRREINELLNSL